MTTRREFMHFLGALPFAGLAVPATAATNATPRVVPRLICALRDRTVSFKRYAAAADAVLSRAVDAMGPGDSLLLIEVGGGFDAGRQVSGASLKEVDPSLMVVPSTYPEYMRTKAGLNKVWEETDRRKVALREAITRPVPIDTANTDIFKALDYASHRLQSFAGERHLVLLSDLVNDIGGVTTEYPPRERYPFSGVDVAALFVPWQGSAQSNRKAQAWQNYFKAAGALKFGVYEEAESLSISVVSPNAVPHQPVNPFKGVRGRL